MCASCTFMKRSGFSLSIFLSIAPLECPMFCTSAQTDRPKPVPATSTQCGCPAHVEREGEKGRGGGDGDRMTSSYVETLFSAVTSPAGTWQQQQRGCWRPQQTAGSTAPHTPFYIQPTLIFNTSLLLFPLLSTFLPTCCSHWLLLLFTLPPPSFHIC